MSVFSYKQAYLIAKTAKRFLSLREACKETCRLLDLLQHPDSRGSSIELKLD